jgi:RNA polymerase sigma-70 factor (ECF subfamily)
VPETIEHYELIRAAQTGDEKAISQLITLYESNIHGLIYSIVGFRDVAQDLSQETFLKMLLALPRYEFRAPFHTWLFRIAINLCRDYLRKKRVRSIVSFLEENVTNNEVYDSNQSPAQDMERSETMNYILKNLSKLPVNLRTVFILRDIQELSYDEIAHTLKWRMGTIKSRLFRARKELALLLSTQFKEGL